MADKIQVKRSTASQWTASNPVLAVGEPGLESDTRLIKYGDGVTAWNSLAYSASPSVVPIRFSAGTAILGQTGSDEAYGARTITSAKMRVGTAPSGSALTVVVQSYNGSVWSDVTTLTIASGSTTPASQTGLSTAQTAGHMIRLNVTSVGSTTAAKDVVVDVVVE